LQPERKLARLRRDESVRLADETHALL